MERKCADPAMQLEIDELILDYLVFIATREIIDDYERRGKLFEKHRGTSKADKLLQLVDGKQADSGTMYPISAHKPIQLF